jgi:plasmid stabilization system protein ParE
MIRSVRVRPEAERDVEIAFAWYEEQRAVLGREFLHELDVVYERIAKFPFLTRSILPRDRRCSASV